MDPSKAISRLLKRPNSSKNDSTSRKSSKRITNSRKRFNSSQAVSSSYKCSSCGDELRNMEALDKHIKERQCPFRQKASISADEVQIIDDEEMKKCSLNRSTSSEAISSFLSGDDWKCLPCKLDFDTWEGLRQHMSAYHPSSQQKAIESSVETGQEDEDEKNDDEEQKKRLSFKCFDCNLVIRTPEAFTEHRRDLHPSPPRQRGHNLPMSLALKKLREEEYKKYEEKGLFNSRQPRTPCQYCKRRFSSAEDLDQHISEDHYLYKKGSLPAVKTGQKDEKEIGNVDDDEEDEEIWLTNEKAIDALRTYAQVALLHYNNQNLGKKYALVAPGPNGAIGTLTHINFKAKEEDCLDAVVETFFAQFTCTRSTRVDCCVSLGPSHKLPNWGKAELNGCRFCTALIHHPPERVANLILDPYNRHF